MIKRLTKDNKNQRITPTAAMPESEAAMPEAATAVMPQTQDVRNSFGRAAILLTLVLVVLFACSVFVFGDTPSVDAASASEDSSGVTEKWRGSILFLIVLLLGTLSFHMKKR